MPCPFFSAPCNSLYFFWYLRKFRLPHFFLAVFLLNSLSEEHLKFSLLWKNLHCLSSLQKYLTWMGPVIGSGGRGRGNNNF